MFFIRFAKTNKKGEKMRYHKISSHAKWYIRIVMILIYLLGLGLLYLLKILFINFIDINPYFPFTINVTLIIKIGVLLFTIITIILFLILPNGIYKNYGFYMDKNYLKIRTGIIFKTISFVLVKHIYKVSTKKKLLGRMFGISSVVLSTSAGPIKISFLDQKKGEVLFNHIAYAIKNYEVE